MSANLTKIILSAISGAHSFDELSRVIVEACAKELDAEVCTIWRRCIGDDDRPGLRLLAASAKAPQTIAQEITYPLHEDDVAGESAEGVTAFVAQTRQEVHVASFSELQQRFHFCWRGKMDRSQWDAKPEQLFKSLYALPLLLGDRLVGVLKVENKKNSTEGFPETDRQALRKLVPEISLAVHSFSLLEFHEKRLIQVPAKMVAALLGPFDPKQLVKEILKTVADALPAEICSLWLVDATGRHLLIAEGLGFSTDSGARHRYNLSPAETPDNEIDGITAWVAVKKRQFWANSWAELKAHPSWRGKWDPAMWKDRDFRCLYAVPLLREDAVIGVLKVENRRGAAIFTDSDRALCGVMANLIVLVLDLGQRLRTSIISDVVHLIRSPIGQVQMNLSGLERELKAVEHGQTIRSERVDNYLALIKKALLSATVTSRTLTSFAVQEPVAIGEGPRRERVALSKLVDDSLAEMEPMLYGNITFNRDYSENALNASIELDVTERTRVQIAIENVLHNAVKYSPHGGEVTASVRRLNNGIVLKIQDHGAGISEEDLARVWDAGFTRRAAGHPEGTGMGLTMVKQTFDRLGWVPTIHSTLGRGTSFEILIPI